VLIRTTRMWEWAAIPVLAAILTDYPVQATADRAKK
jgi:hypothetical protein